MDYQLDSLALDDILQEPSRVPACPDAEGADVLQALTDHIVWFASLDEWRATCSREPEIVGMRRHGVPYAPCQWFGPLSDAERQRYSRATMRLEREGYLTRITERHRDRVTHLVPTLNGLMWVLRSEGMLNTDSLAVGLRRTEWGGRLADELEIALR